MDTSQLLYRVLRASFNGSLQGLGIEPSKSHQNGKIDDPSLCCGCVCSWIVSQKCLSMGPATCLDGEHPECLQRPFLGDTPRLSRSASLIDFYLSELSFGEFLRNSFLSETRDMQMSTFGVRLSYFIGFCGPPSMDRCRALA